MALGAALLYEQVTEVSKEVVKTLYPERVLVNGSMMTVSTEYRPGTRSYEYFIWNSVGTAAIYSDLSNDIPKINTGMEKRTGYMRPLVIGFDYSIFTDMTDKQYNLGYVRNLVEAAADQLMADLERIAFDGEATHNLLGLISNPNVPVYTLPNDGTGASTRFVNKTSAQVYRDMVNACSAMRVTTNWIFHPTDFAFEGETYDYILNTVFVPPGGTSSGNETIYSVFLRNQALSPYGVKNIHLVPYLQGRGVGGTNMAVLYQRSDKNFKGHIPSKFGISEPRHIANAYAVDCHAITGGVEFRRPQALMYIYGV
jgi:hypothetical protein